MGNRNSTPPASSVDVVRRPPSRPKGPPSSRPVSQLGPNGPSYNSPENRVLPKEIPIMKLRPVSMELSKYHPEFQNIFSNNADVDGEETIDVNGENIDLNFNSPPRPTPPIQNGHIPGKVQNSNTLSASILPNGHVPTDKRNGAIPNGEVESASATSVASAPAPYRPHISHKRQMSLTTNLTNQEHTIFEEPEENIDHRGKIDPLFQSYPGVSLPVKNNFNLDYSYQLTYVQLAEHRRQKTMEELEKRTGKKLSDLSADLNENIEKPAFMRDSLTRISTRSTGSGGSALTNKKKRAPAPPQNATPASPSRNQNRVYSVDNEPPIDYDQDSPRRSVTLPRYTTTPVSHVAPVPVAPSNGFSSRNNKNSPPKAPPRPMFNSSHKTPNLSRNNSMSNGTPEIILRKVPSVNITPQTPETEQETPWLTEIRNLSQSIAARRQISVESTETAQPPNDAEKTDEENNNTFNMSNIELTHTSSTQSKLIFESSKDEFITVSNEDTQKENDNSCEMETTNNSKKLERNNSLKSPAKSSAVITRHHSTTVYDRQSTPILLRQSSAPNSADPVRRLNSLLQHDIKTAAMAQCHKLVKQPTTVAPKPKDPHEVFREQLAKACTDRDERAKLEGSIDEKLNLHNKNVGQEVQEVKENFEKESPVQSPASEKKEPPKTRPKPPRYHKNVTTNKYSSSNIRQRQQIPLSPEQESEQKASKSFEWTPEDDLDSDDNLSDREAISARKGKSEGFKSTIIPNAVSDLKKKNKKMKEKKYKSSENLDDHPINKYGSIKRFKKSMHKSVMNAFGSISRASGKVLHKQKSEDVAEVSPKNWKLSTNGPLQNGDVMLDRSSKYRVPDESDSESELFEDRHSIDFVETDFRQNAEIHSEDTSESDDDHKSPQKIKRAGVAYLNSKGQLVLLPDYDTVEVDDNGRQIKKKDDGRAPKLYEKKKKYTYDATPRRKEREENEKVVSEEIRQREKQMEGERRKQLEIELEMHKIREAETRERLQRLEAAHLHQQINAQFLQQQQQQQQQQQLQQNLPMLTAPPLPPVGTFQPNYSMTDNSHVSSFANLYGQQIPQNGYIYGANGTHLNPGLPYADVNDYIRLMGSQNPQTTQQAQQVAFLLNNVNLMGQPFERRSNPALYDMFNTEHIKQYPSQTVDYQANDSIGNKQNYNRWASAPNINSESVNNSDSMINEFVNKYNDVNTDEKKNEKSHNPVYASDDSDEGLSPVRTVARAQVEDYRPLPVRTESGKFMRKYGGVHIHVRQDSENSEHSKSDNDVQCNGFIPRRRSISPTNSVSTTDSALTSTSLSLSTQSSPSKSSGAMASPAITTKFGQDGYRTVVDLTTGTDMQGLPDDPYSYH